eukprot:461877_1
MQYMNSFKNKKQSQIIHQQNKNAKKKSNRWRHHKQKSYYKKSLKKRIKSYRHNKNFHEWNLFMVGCINHSLYYQMEDETFIERWISEQHYEFVNAKCNNINYYYNYMNEYKIKWKHEFKQQSQLIDSMTNECIIKIELCELYHCSKVMTGGLSSRGSYIAKHHIVGKVKYKTTNSTELFAYLWIEFDSDYDKYAWIRNRVLRKHWIDLYDILIQNCYSGYVAIDCYAFLGDEYSFINSKQIWN